MKLPPNPYVRAFRVYLEDTDAGGHMYHANYLRFAERARTDLLQELGISHRDEHATGRFYVVSELNVKYRAPAFVGDELKVTSHIKKLTPARIIFHQQVARSDALVAELEVTVACINKEGTPVRLSAASASAFKAWQLMDQS